ncbi:hypothetical protein W97_04381 [Coniosporium apollinis CBS 100218]|uniref:Oxysterol-binding protein n=1 Tax=Coniosporium apollinis (strain CBS 100218) TaxID=1168221 RepID=R7YTL5_CONA1|nr:uncharacterized protein W97_04381 [Coniosporium apollinis CBS 100218]EON65144.1 hypothetical protein W97_04381 [Coniosporium apollinis CBS 100218]
MASTSSGPPSEQPSVVASAASSIKSSRPTTPSNAPSEKAPDDSSKLKTFLGILRRFIGVSDIAAVRFSLPAQLLEPTPNLEYWNYLDRPETFVRHVAPQTSLIGDSPDPLGRMLGTLRFWFTKDLKYVKGKPCKPYNSTLGEFFRCNWVVEDTAPSIRLPSTEKPAQPDGVGPKSNASGRPIKVSYLTEQTSHHPPVSAFFIACPEKGILARGFDQLSAKFTGTSVKVTPGAHNLGIFITLEKWGNEEYQLTHPAAHLGGFLRGNLNVTVADSCFISCPKTGIKVILQYLEEGWLGKAQNKVEGVIFRYTPATETTTRLKDVPDKDILGRVEGCWHDKVYYTLCSESFGKNKVSHDKHLLIDLNPLYPIPKLVPPEDLQLPNESRRFWYDVTAAINNKQYSLATQVKQEIEERQRQKAKERETRGVEWKPRFFTSTTAPDGRPDLTADGWTVLKGMQMDDFRLTANEEAGAY